MTRQQERSGFKLSPLLQDNEDGGFIKWRVENSWGEDHGHKGELKLVISTHGTWSLLSVSRDRGRKQPRSGGFFSHGSPWIDSSREKSEDPVCPQYPLDQNSTPESPRLTQTRMC